MLGGQLRGMIDHIHMHTCLGVSAEHVVAGHAHVVELDPPVVDAVQAHLGALFMYVCVCLF